MPGERAPHALVLCAWLLEQGPLRMLSWLCQWPARIERAIGEAMLEEIFSPGGPTTGLPLTARALRRVFRLSRQATWSRRP